MDAALGGGYREGSVVGVEVDRTAGPAEVGAIAVPALANYLALGGGAIVVQPWGAPASLWHDALLAHLPASVVDGRFRSADYAAAEAVGDWQVPIGRYGRAETIRAMARAERAARGPDPAGKLLEVSSVDALEAAVGPEAAVRMFGAGLPRTRAGGNVALVLSLPGSQVGPSILGSADLRLHLARTETGVVVGGVRPSFLPMRIGP